MARRNEGTTDDEQGIDTARAEAEDIVDDEFDGLTDADVASEGERSGDDDAAIATNGASLDDDDEPLTDDAGDGDLAPAAADRGDGRDAQGKFVKKEGEATAAKDGAAAGTAQAAAGAATGAAKDGAAEAPKWEPLQLKADKTIVPIEEARVSRGNGHHFVVVKDANFPRFVQRLQRAHLFERSRQAIAEREKAYKRSTTKLYRAYTRACRSTAGWMTCPTRTLCPRVGKI
jgi:hypothetical protein